MTEGGDRSQTIRRLLLWLLLLILVLAPAFIDSAALHERVGIVDLAGKQRAFRPILLNYFGLTPPDSCDNLGLVWPISSHEKRELSTFRMGLVVY